MSYMIMEPHYMTISQTTRQKEKQNATRTHTMFRPQSRPIELLLNNLLSLPKMKKKKIISW